MIVHTKKITLRGSRFAVIFLILFLLSIPGLSQTTQISWSTFSTGFGESGSSSAVLKSITGQPFAGTGSSGTSVVGAGFFYNPDAAGTITSINNLGNGIPTVYELNQNYPNPFNPSTVISYQLPVGSHVSLEIYDILGRAVKTLVNKEQSAGNYKVTFDGSNLSSGIYLYRIRAGDYVSTKKLILLR